MQPLQHCNPIGSLEIPVVGCPQLGVFLTAVPKEPPHSSYGCKFFNGRIDQVSGNSKLAMSKNELILYVEDNIANRLLVRRVLEASGYSMIEAENAKQALEAIQSHDPDLILMDINMPDIDGYTLTGQLKQIQKLKSVPIIALTANVMRGDRERTIEAGCDGYIQKPIDVDTLPEQIAEYIREA